MLANVSTLDRRPPELLVLLLPTPTSILVSQAPVDYDDADCAVPPLGSRTPRGTTLAPAKQVSAPSARTPRSATPARLLALERWGNLLRSSIDELQVEPSAFGRRVAEDRQDGIDERKLTTALPLAQIKMAAFATLYAVSLFIKSFHLELEGWGSPRRELLGPGRSSNGRRHFFSWSVGALVRARTVLAPLWWVQHAIRGRPVCEGWREDAPGQLHVVSNVPPLTRCIPFARAFAVRGKPPCPCRARRGQVRGPRPRGRRDEPLR